MKKNLMKKVFAVTLSVAMACSIVPATNPVTASAAASVKLKTTFKTLEVGAKYKLTLKNNTQKWKVVKATSKDPKIAKVYKTTTKAVKVKGKSEGRAVVKVRLKTTQKKTNNVKNLKCKFNVVDNSTPAPNPTPDPTPDPTPVKKEATVKNQEELDAALDDKNIEKITIDATEGNFVIKEGEYKTTDLIVNAPNSDVENNATFRNITIQAIKGETWKENAKGNTIKVLDKDVSIIVGENASVSGINLVAENGKMKLVVNGTVANITISAKANVTIGGKSKAPIKITIESNAKGTEVDTEVPVDVETATDMKANLREGAEGSKITMTVAGTSVAVDNKSKAAVAITKHDGTKDSVGAGRTSTVNSPANGTTTNPGTTTPGTNTPVNKVDYKGNGLDLHDVVINTGASIYVTTGGASVISGGTLTFTVSGAKEVSGAAIECSARIKSDVGDFNRFMPYQDCTDGTSFSVSPIVTKGNKFIIELTFRVKATNVTNAGPASDKYTYTINFEKKNVEGYTLATEAQITGEGTASASKYTAPTTNNSSSANH